MHVDQRAGNDHRTKSEFGSFRAMIVTGPGDVDLQSVKKKPNIFKGIIYIADIRSLLKTNHYLYRELHHKWQFELKL
jgi:hypothetical protein